MGVRGPAGVWWGGPQKRNTWGQVTNLLPISSSGVQGARPLPQRLPLRGGPARNPSPSSRSQGPGGARQGPREQGCALGSSHLFMERLHPGTQLWSVAACPTITLLPQAGWPVDRIPPARARSPWARLGNLRACASNQAPGSRTGAPDPATGPRLEQPSLRGLSFSSGRGTARRRRWESAGSARLSRPIRGRPRPRGRAPPAPGRPGQGRVASRAG